MSVLESGDPFGRGREQHPVPGVSAGVEILGQTEVKGVNPYVDSVVVHTERGGRVKSSGRVVVAAGHNMLGLTLGPASAELAINAVGGHQLPSWSAPFDANRFGSRGYRRIVRDSPVRVRPSSGPAPSIATGIVACRQEMWRKVGATATRSSPTRPRN